jgi:hypothetical protein
VVNLGYQDLLELLGYVDTRRRALEILGFEYSARGNQKFQEEHAYLVPRIRDLIGQSLDEAGSFPRELTPELLSEGTYLNLRPDGAVELWFDVETGISSTAHVHEVHTSLSEAIDAFLKRLLDPAYLNVRRGTSRDSDERAT